MPKRICGRIPAQRKRDSRIRPCRGGTLLSRATLMPALDGLESTRAQKRDGLRDPVQQNDPWRTGIRRGVTR